MLNNLNKKSLGLFLARHKALEACLVALFLIVAVFPDVIFLGASFRLTDQVAGGQHGLSPKTFYRIPITTGWWGGYNDNGGAIYQSEPMMEFMRYSIKSVQSPYWNPYSAAGSLGPETLVDQKFSAFTLINAILGGGSAIYNATMLLLFYFAVFFLYRIVRERLQLSVLAGVAAALFYLLNGYSTANFGSNVAQSYLYVPMCLYASLTFLEKATTARFVAIVFSFAVFLSCTFIPTTVTSFIAIYAIIIGYVFAKIGQRELNYRSGATLIILQSTGVVLSVFLLAVLYLPIFENIRSTGTLEAYSNRIFYALNFPQAIASLFSPSHLYESYNAMEAAAISWNDGFTKNGITGNTIFHMGVIAITLSGCALSLRRHPYNRLAIICALCVLLAFFRLFEPYIIERLMSHIPIVGKIGCQYWWPAVMFPVAFLVGFGIDNLQQHNARIIPALLLLIIGVAAVSYVYKIYGFHEPYIGFKLAALLLLSMLTTIVIALLLTLRFNRSAPLAGMIVIALVTGLFIELVVDSKMARLPKSDIFSTPSEAIAYVRKNIGLYRTLNFGQGGLYAEMGSALQIQEITSMNQGVLPGYQDYFYSAVNLDSSKSNATRGSFPSLWQIQDKPLSHRLNWQALDLLSVKYVFLPADFTAYKAELVRQGLRSVYETPTTVVFENPNVLPRAFSVNLPDGEIESEVILPTDFRERIHPATITSYRNAAVEIKGTASEKMLVVITDNWHQKWLATMNGIDVPIIKINSTFRGVVVPQGDYVIKMSYQPRTLPWAIGISLVTLLLLMVMLLGRRRLDALIHLQWPKWAVAAHRL